MFNLADSAKAQIIEFVKTTKDGEQYLLGFPGNEKKARAYVHTMRVELSRLRQKVLERGRSIRRFKVLLIKLVPHTFENGEGFCIVLERQNKHVAAQADIEAVIDDISSGEMLPKEIING